MAINPNEVFTTSNGFKIPYKIISERRRSARASLGQKELSIRIPSHARRKWKEEKIVEFLKWADQVASKKPISLIRFYPFEYGAGDIITLYDKEYSIASSLRENSKFHLRIVDNTFIIPESALNMNSKKLIHRSISNILKSRYLPIFIQKVDEINQRTLKADYSSAHMNHTSSKWGSCDSKGRIWLSTRLLCMPEQIHEYIIIHELAHRIEGNHSRRFWSIVANHCPNYKLHMKWLKNNGGLCDFYPERVKQMLLAL